MPITKGHKPPDRPEPEYALLPCPFCGSTNLFIDWDDHAPNFWVNCNTDDCMDLGPFGASEEEAAERWNKRAEGTRLRAIADAAAAYQAAHEALDTCDDDYLVITECRERIREARRALFGLMEEKP